MTFITEFNNIMWGWVLAVILLGTGLLYGFTMGFPQVRCFHHIIRSLKSTLKSDDGAVSGFAALCAAVGGQVGTGSLVGVASALAAGGPGALFWMWIYGNIRHGSELWGGDPGAGLPRKGQGRKLLWGRSLLYDKGTGEQASRRCLCADHYICCRRVYRDAPEQFHHIRRHRGCQCVSWIPGIIVTVITAVIVLGGVKRITDAASLIVPFMAVGYILITIIIIITHLGEVPAMFGTIFQSAFTLKL